MLSNINFSCPGLKNPAQAREFGEARRVMDRVKDVGQLCADKNDVAGYDLDSCPNSVTMDRARFNRQFLPSGMSRDVGNSYPDAGYFTGVVNLDGHCGCEKPSDIKYVNVEREFGGSSCYKRTETFKLEESNGMEVYTLRRQDETGNDSLQRVTFDPARDLLSYELNPKKENPCG